VSASELLVVLNPNVGACHKTNTFSASVPGFNYEKNCARIAALFKTNPELQRMNTGKYEKGKSTCLERKKSNSTIRP
jgi:hypothetical protein